MVSSCDVLVQRSDIGSERLDFSIEKRHLFTFLCDGIKLLICLLLAGRSPAVVRLSIDRIEKNIESIESKITKIFKRPKNREDGSDFDDFLTESIVSP